MATEASNMRAPEDIEGTDFECDNLDDGGIGEDFDAIDADEDEEYNLTADKMQNPISKSDDDEDDWDHKNDDDDDTKKSDDDDDDFGDDDDDDDDLKKQAKKGGLTEASLKKSIANLLGMVQKSDPQARKKALLKATMAGRQLNKSQQAELMQLLGGGAAQQARPARKLSKSLTEDRTIQRTVDASEFLSRQNDALVTALNSMEKSFHEMSTRQTEFNVALAQALAHTGRSVAQLNKSMQVADAAPVSGPKSMGARSGRARPLAKSNMAEGQLSRGQVEASLDALFQKSLSAGRKGASEAGQDLVKAIAHFDSSGQLLPEVEPEVRRYIRENR